MTKVPTDNAQAKALWERILSDCEISHDDLASTIDHRTHGKPITMKQAIKERAILKKAGSWLSANGYEAPEK